MSLHLDVSAELESRLRTKAGQLGVSVEHLVTELLAAGVGEERRQMTGKELVERWKSQDVIGSRSEIRDPAKYARKLRSAAERRLP